MHIAVGACTDVGMIRSGNEDRFFADADERRGIFVVADGMGGHAAGEVASEMAVDIIARELLPLTSATEDGASHRLMASVREANAAIHQRTLMETDKHGMGTTATVLVLSDEGYIIGQVGDSRVYLLRNGTFRQLTKDHSFVQEQVDAGLLTPEQARYHPYSNVITRCVGASPHVEADVFTGEVRAGDVFLLSSDGLTGMVDDHRLHQLLLARTSPGRMVDALISEANERGGLDNITAIVIQVVSLNGAGDA